MKPQKKYTVRISTDRAGSRQLDLNASDARLIRLVVTGHYIEATRIAEEMDAAVSRRIERTVLRSMPACLEVAA